MITLARRLLLPGAMTATMVAGTAALGTWQVQRLHWKTALLAELDRGEGAAPVPLSDNPWPFTKVRVEGVLRTDLQALYGTDVRTTRAGPASGAFIVNPLERPGLPPVMVQRGWAPQGWSGDGPPGPAVIEGYVRPPENPVRFGATDNPAARRFYALNPATIGQSLGLPLVASFTVVALGPSVPGTYPTPAQALPRPANNHLSYAITWFGLAVSGLVIFLVYARKVLRA